MRIGATGDTGFLGRYTVNHLASAGHFCRCWYRPESDQGGFENVQRQIEWIPGELGDRATCRRLVEGCDAVVHAALSHPDGGFRGKEGNVLEFVEKNVLGTLQLIEAARQAGVGRFVFLSSCRPRKDPRRSAAGRDPPHVGDQPLRRSQGGHRAVRPQLWLRRGLAC